MALSQLFWDVLMPWNLKSTYFSLKMIHFLSLNIWYVIYVVFWMKYWNLKLPHHCILFLFTICTVSQLFWNRVCTLAFTNMADILFRSDLHCILSIYQFELKSASVFSTTQVFWPKVFSLSVECFCSVTFVFHSCYSRAELHFSYGSRGRLRSSRADAGINSTTAADEIFNRENLITCDTVITLVRVNRRICHVLSLISMYTSRRGLPEGNTRQPSVVT